MDKSEMINEINEEMSKKIGYTPYIFKNGKILCASCHREMVSADKATLTKTKIIKDSENLPHDIHSCPFCKYMQGVNVSLKKRISEVKKELGLHEFPTGLMKNKYFKPGEKYNFIDPTHSENISVFENELYDRLNKKRLELASSINETSSKTEEKLKETVSTESEEKVLTDKTKETQPTSETDNSTEVIPTTSNEEIKEGSESKEKSFFDDEDDLSKLFESNEQVLNETNNEDNNETDQDVESSTESDDLDEIFGSEKDNIQEKIHDVEDDLDDIFKDDNKKGKTDTSSTNFNSQVPPSPYVDRKTINDPNIESMIKQNKEEAESDIFQATDRKDSVFNIIKRSRIVDLTESYTDSNAKIVVDRILSLFEKRGNKKLKHKIYISDLTHECPVVDFEGNIRLIFVNLDIPGGQYNVEAEINGRLKPTFSDSSEYDMMTFVIFSDMIETGVLNRVVRAVSKNIAFNLKIKGIFNPISIIKDSDQYFYTTADFDRETIARFDIENSAGNVEKPFNGQVALISRWNNPNVDDMWKYRKELSNRSILAHGGDINYDDLSMFMTCSMRYIILPQKPDGSINVTIVDYIESLDLFIRDGFGALIGVLLHNIKTSFPNSKIHLYYELDMSSIPSPTISRYVKNESIRPVMVNPEFTKFNTIIDKVSSQNGANNVARIPVEGEPFDSPEYNANFWRTYVLAPEYRRFVADNRRNDWRRYGKKTFEKTLGERFREFKNVNVSDRKARQAVLEKLGYQTVVQPQVIKAVVNDNFGKTALMTVIQSCSGMFSISQYMKANRSTVVDDSYMNTAKVNPSFNPINGVYMTPQQQMAAMQQQMWMQQMYPGNFNQK